jgi:catechol 2,3-dioxygenase-like lactoylglutathione lyase family enzyme/predicted enzyme related to lactoylglutathione lyase
MHMKFSQFTVLVATVAAGLTSAQAQSPSSRPRITGVSHISVYASDSAAAERLYVQDLGAAKRPDPENAAGVRYYFSPIQFVEVLPLPANQSDPKNRLDHVAFNTTNAEALRKYLAANNVKVPAQVQKGSDGSVWFEVEDPEANHIQFIQPPAHPEAVPLNPLSNHIIHVGFIVHNADAENAFFRKVLGFRPYWYGGRNGKTEWISQQVPDGTDWLEYMVQGGPETHGIPAAMTQQTAGVLNHFSLGVPNMEKAYNLLYGEDRVSPKDALPKIGADGKWQLNLYDPDGTRAEVMEFQPVIKPCCSDFTAASPTK